MAVLQLDAFAFSIIVLVMMLFIIHTQGNKPSPRQRLFSYILLSTLLMLVSESIGIMMEGRPGPVNRLISETANFILHALPTLPFAFWIAYFQYHTTGDLKAVKKNIINKLPVLISLLIGIYTLKTGFVYTLDTSNHRHMHNGIYVLYVLNSYYYLAAARMLFKTRANVDKKTRSAFLAFAAFPMAAAYAQLFSPEIPLIWNSVTLSLLLFFYYIELEGLRRDYLTGLANRRQGEDWIERKMRKGGKEEEFGLVMIDLDDFKQINDTFGHMEGDIALKIFGNILGKSLKSSDKIARFAGDEFLLIIDRNGEEAFHAICSRINERLDSFNDRAIKKYKIEYSAGYTAYDPERHKAVRDLLHDADVQMYEYKKEKKRLRKGAGF